MTNKVRGMMKKVVILTAVMVLGSASISPNTHTFIESQYFMNNEETMGQEVLSTTAAPYMVKSQKIVEKITTEELVEYLEADKKRREEEEARERARLAEIARKEEEERQRLEKIRKRQEYKENITVNSSNINQSSNLSVEHMAQVLKSTGLAGTEQAFYKLDREGINFFFAVSVSIQESGWQTNSYRANAKNDVFGITSVNRYYKSKQDCIYYFGDFIKRLYINQGLTSVDVINAKYCPSTTEWAGGVKSHMKKLYNIALNIMG